MLMSDVADSGPRNIENGTDVEERPTSRLDQSLDGRSSFLSTEKSQSVDAIDYPSC